MKIIEPQRMDKKASIDDQKVKLDYNFKVLHEGMQDLEDQVRMSSSDCPSLEGVIGRVIATTAAYMLNPLLGIGLGLMSFDGVITALDRHDVAIKKSRTRSLLMAFFRPGESDGARDLGREIGEKFADQPTR